MGHLGIARAAQTLLQLDIVLFTPVGSQPLKPMGSSASFEDRIAMTELAIRDLPNFAISLADAPDPAGEPNYTIDTLHRLQAQFPSAQLFNLMGADSFLSLNRWYRGADIPFAAPLIVASRPGQHLEHLAAELPDGLTIEPASQASKNRPGILEVFTVRNASGTEGPLYLLPGLEIEISASEIRMNVSATLDRRRGHNLLPDAVCDYISAHHLYQPA